MRLLDGLRGVDFSGLGDDVKAEIVDIPVPDAFNDPSILPSGADVGLDYSGRGTSTWDVNKGAFNYKQSDVIGKPVDVVDKISSEIKTAVSTMAAPFSRTASPTPSIQQRSGGSPMPSTSGSFTSTISSVTNGILSIVAPIAAAKQQKKVLRVAAGPRVGAGKITRTATAGSGMNTYLLLGGGVLIVGLLVYMVAKD